MTFRNESGVELFDLPDAPRPDAETPSPVRFLPEYDNVVLSHADRSRVLPEAFRKRGAIGAPTFLVDGFVSGTWRLRMDDGTARLAIAPYEKLAAHARDEVTAEAGRLAAFLVPDASRRDVVVT